MIKEREILLPLIFLSWKLVGDSLNKLGDSDALIPRQILYSVDLLEMWMSLQNLMLLFWKDFSKSCYTALWGWVGCLPQSRVKDHECRHFSSCKCLMATGKAHSTYAGQGGLSDFEMSSF